MRTKVVSGKVWTRLGREKRSEGARREWGGKIYSKAKEGGKKKLANYTKVRHESLTNRESLSVLAQTPGYDGTETLDAFKGESE